MPVRRRMINNDDSQSAAINTAILRPCRKENLAARSFASYILCEPQSMAQQSRISAVSFLPVGGLYDLAVRATIL